MKPSALTLALIATVSTFAAEPASPPSPSPDTKPPAAAPAPSLSAEVQQQMAATLPGNAPPAAVKPADNAATIASIREQSIARAPANQQTPDTEVLELPKMTVKQQPRPRVRLGESTILGPKAFNDELAKKNLGTFDRSVLNKFTLPAWLGGVSAADRAREDYNLAQKQQFMSDVLTISKAVEQTDPAAAKALRDAAAKP